MRLPNDVRAAKCSERWMGLRSPVSCAKPTTSEDDTVFSSVSVMPTDRSSKNSVRSGGRFIWKRYHGCTKTKSHYAISRYYCRLRMSFPENRNPLFGIIRHCLDVAPPPEAGPRGSSRFVMHFLMKA